VAQILVQGTGNRPSSNRGSGTPTFQRMRGSAWRLPWWLIMAAQGLFVAGDALFSVNELVLHIEPFPSLAAALYLPGYLLLGAAGLHPSMAGLSEPARRQVARLGRGRLLAMAATVAATACDALAKATKKASPWVSTSRPSRSRKHSRSRHRWSARAPP
jgi:hypothetical protein